MRAYPKRCLTRFTTISNELQVENVTKSSSRSWKTRRYGSFVHCIPRGAFCQCLILENEVDRTENGSKELTEILSRNNIIYDDVKTYDIQSESKSEGGIITSDYITFASSSGVNAFFESGYAVSENTKIVCIGEITAKALHKYNIADYKIAKTKDVVGIINTIISDVKKESDF